MPHKLNAMTRIAVMSDLHLEKEDYQAPPMEVDLVVLAGDIIESQAGSPVEWAKRNLPENIPAIFVPGNHDFYRGRMGQLLGQWRKQAQDSHIHVLNNEAVDVAGLRVLGTPLWSGLELFRNPIHEAHLKRNLPMLMKDFAHIRKDNGRTWTTRNMLDAYAQSVAFLEKELADNEGALVVTHWPAHIESISPEFDGDILLPYFVNHLPHLVGKSGAWIHGHVHDRFCYRIGEDPSRGLVVCNPRGYPHEREAGSVYQPLIFKV